MLTVSYFILVLCFHGCVFLFESYNDKYEIINLVLSEQLKSEYKTLLVDDTDTIIFKNLIVDKFTRSKLMIAPSGKDKQFFICGKSNTHLKVNKYFDIKDLRKLKEKLNNEKPIELDQSKIIRNDLLINYSSFLQIDSRSNTNIALSEMWDKYHESDYNYSSICQPLINTSKDKAIIGLNICVSNYLLTRVFGLSKNKEGVWCINSKITVIDKFSEERVRKYDSKSKEYIEKVIYVIYVGTLYE